VIHWIADFIAWTQQTARKGTWLMSYRDLMGCGAIAVGEIWALGPTRGLPVMVSKSLTVKVC